MTYDGIGVGRVAYRLQTIDFENVRKAVNFTRRSGAKINYLLHNPNLTGECFSNDFKQNINLLLGKLSGIGVEIITVANIYIAKLILQNYKTF